MRTGVEVGRILVERGRAKGVLADGERLTADVVVLAAGAWSGALAAELGGGLPVGPVRGQMLAVSNVPVLISHAIHGDDIYLVPRPSGELLIGATIERVGFERAVTPDGLGGLIAQAVALVPEANADRIHALARSGLMGRRSGILSATQVLDRYEEAVSLVERATKDFGRIDVLHSPHHHTPLVLAPPRPKLAEFIAEVMASWRVAGGGTRNTALVHACCDALGASPAVLAQPASHTATGSARSTRVTR